MKSHYYTCRVDPLNPIKHATAALAAAEAEKLAAQHPGDTFEVLQCLAITRTSAPSTFWLDGCGPEEVVAAKPWSFDWSKVPEGFDYPAMDKDKQWAAFKCTPDKDHEEWGPEVIGLDFRRFDHPPFPGDWKDSLQTRPVVATPPPPPEPGYIEITDPEEIIREGDEFKLADGGRWTPCTKGIGASPRVYPALQFRRPDPTRRVVPIPEEYPPLPPLPEGKTQWVGRGKWDPTIRPVEANSRTVFYRENSGGEWYQTARFSDNQFHIEAI